MKLYKIKHIPTGKYISKWRSFPKLTSRGKIYQKTGPIDKWVDIRYCPEIKSHDELEWEEVKSV